METFAPRIELIVYFTLGKFRAKFSKIAPKYEMQIMVLFLKEKSEIAG